MKSIKLFLSLLLVAGMLTYSSGAMSADAPKPKGVKPWRHRSSRLKQSRYLLSLEVPADRRGNFKFN